VVRLKGTTYLNGLYSNLNNDVIHKESWETFGQTIEDYISKNKGDLEKSSIDIILGFSRGGTILAFAFACILKDMDSEVYSKQFKASVRTIPGGASIKLNDPCFIMNQAANAIEIEDITKKLEKDLGDFSIKYKNGDRLNVLIMDDNLTGATRVKYLEDKLKMMPVVGGLGTLAYVRHKAFQESEIKTIQKFPSSAEIFVMPWHKPHSRRDLEFLNEELDLARLRHFNLKVLIKLNNRFSSWKDFENSINWDNYFRLLDIEGRKLLISGASMFNMMLQDDSEQIIMKFEKHLLYPPKKCLKPLNSDLDDNGKMKFYNLCSDEIKRTKATCLMCSILNCNKELFARVLGQKERQGKIKLSLDSYDDRDNMLKDVANNWINWFEKLYPDI
jgi:hypothetical protein